MFQTEVVEKIKTHILCSVTFSSRNSAVYEIMWKKIVEQGRPQMKRWRMRISYWVSKATNTHSGYVLLIEFQLKQWLLELASLLRLYVYCLRCS